MSDETPLLKELKSYGDELLPGSAEALAQRWGSTMGKLSPAGLAAEVARRLDPVKGVGKSHLNPSYKPPDGQTSLTRVLGRLATQGVIPKGSAEELARRWGPDFAARAHTQVAQEVLQRLGRLENREFLADRPPLPAAAQQIASALTAHFSTIVPHGAREQFALDRMDLARTTQGPGSESRLVANIARALTTGVTASKYGLSAPLGNDDPRLSGLPPQRVEPAKSEPGPPANGLG